jgi:hypothetical protein
MLESATVEGEVDAVSYSAKKAALRHRRRRRSKGSKGAEVAAVLARVGTLARIADRFDKSDQSRAELLQESMEQMRRGDGIPTSVDAWTRELGIDD